MAISTYDDLINSIHDYTLRSDSPASLFISMAESDLTTLVKHYLNETIENVPLVSDSITFPNDFLELRSVKAGDFPTRQLGISDTTIYPGEICYRRVGNKLFFVGDLSQVSTIELVYWARIPALSESNQSNWLLEKFPSVYLHAALAKAYRWAKDDVAEAAEKQSLIDVLSLVAEDDKRGRAFASAPDIRGGGW